MLVFVCLTNWKSGTWMASELAPLSQMAYDEENVNINKKMWKYTKWSGEYRNIPIDDVFWRRTIIIWLILFLWWFLIKSLVNEFLVLGEFLVSCWFWVFLTICWFSFWRVFGLVFGRDLGVLSFEPLRAAQCIDFRWVWASISAHPFGIEFHVFGWSLFFDELLNWFFIDFAPSWLQKVGGGVPSTFGPFSHPFCAHLHLLLA